MRKLDPLSLLKLPVSVVPAERPELQFPKSFDVRAIAEAGSAPIARFSLPSGHAPGTVEIRGAGPVADVVRITGERVMPTLRHIETLFGWVVLATLAPGNTWWTALEIELTSNAVSPRLTVTLIHPEERRDIVAASFLPAAIADRYQSKARFGRSAAEIATLVTTLIALGELEAAIAFALDSRAAELSSPELEAAEFALADAIAGRTELVKTPGAADLLLAMSSS